MPPLLPSRWEDLQPEFRPNLRPDPALLDLVKRQHASMQVTKGIRFLPIYGESGAGKTCAAMQLATHLPNIDVQRLDRSLIESEDPQALVKFINSTSHLFSPIELVIYVVDQYEESVAQKGNIPTRFLDQLSALDRSGKIPKPVLFLWLTTSLDFQSELVGATSRNRRILASNDFAITGPARENWPNIISSTFEFHNGGKILADCQIMLADLARECESATTIGDAIKRIGDELSDELPRLVDISDYRVIQVWPVADGQSIERVQHFASPVQGYTLNWSAFEQRLVEADRSSDTLAGLNKARLYFDMRVVPLPISYLMQICTSLADSEYVLPKTSLDLWERMHLHRLVAETWTDTGFGPLKEREAEKTKVNKWYENIPNQQAAVCRRLAALYRQLDRTAVAPREIITDSSKVQADVGVERSEGVERTSLLELKVFAADRITPATVRDQIKSTLRKYAALAGFVAR